MMKFFNLEVLDIVYFKSDRVTSEEFDQFLEYHAREGNEHMIFDFDCDVLVYNKVSKEFLWL